jgi:UDP:flavonoid glycosyltransferase YjiC (YdhE family)
MRVLFAWEIGSNISHVARMAEVARALHRKKAILFFAVQQPAALRPHLEGMRYELFQAPHVRGKTRGASLIYPDELRGWGYDNPEILAGQIVAWRSLFTAIKPDVLVAQQAPTALLAARPYKFKTVSIGTGYDVPPLTAPMSALHYWEKLDETVIERREGAVVGVINEALADLNLAGIKSFSEALKVNKEFLTTFEELDHYPNRNARNVVKSNYVGPFYNMEAGKSVAWEKAEDKKRVLAFLQPGKSAKACLLALQSAPKNYDIIAAVPGLPAKLIEKISRPNLRVFGEAVRLDKLIKKCDLGISHASTGISSAFALHGVPQLMMPMTIEQFMFARAVGRAKAGLGMAGTYKQPDVIRMVRQITEKPEYKAGAQGLAKKYKDFDPAGLALKIGNDIDKLVG